MLFWWKCDIIIGRILKMWWDGGREDEMTQECEKLVSIVVPVHNGENFIAETIGSVQAQSYRNWELIIVDDGSTDKTVEIVKGLMGGDLSVPGLDVLGGASAGAGSIKLIRLEGNQGAAKARNAGMREARGEYLAFLDADDLWLSEKLEEQVKFMIETGAAFSFTGYEFADATGKPNGKKVSVPSTITYRQALKNTTIWTSTVMFDMGRLTVEDVEMPDVRRGQDTATWWKVLKKVECAYGLNEVLSYYRRSSHTLSSNKLTALKRTWNLYRNVEKLGLIRSFDCFVAYCFNAARRRV